MSATSPAPPEDGRTIPVSGASQQASFFVLGAFLLAVGTPAVTSLTQPGSRFYLRQPIIYGAQIVPYVVAALLWLPWRSPRATRIGLRLARLLFVANLLFYVPIITGLLPTGGDMIALGYVLFAAVTTACVVVATLVAFAISWALSRRAAMRQR